MCLPTLDLTLHLPWLIFISVPFPIYSPVRQWNNVSQSPQLPDSLHSLFTSPSPAEQSGFTFYVTSVAFKLENQSQIFPTIFATFWVPTKNILFLFVAFISQHSIFHTAVLPESTLNWSKLLPNWYLYISYTDHIILFLPQHLTKSYA